MGTAAVDLNTMALTTGKFETPQRGRVVFIGEKAFYPSFQQGSLNVYDYSTNKLIRIAVGPFPMSIAYAAGKLYITIYGHPLVQNSFSWNGSGYQDYTSMPGEVVVVDPNTLAIISRIKVENSPWRLAVWGEEPQQLPAIEEPPQQVFHQAQQQQPQAQQETAPVQQQQPANPVDQVKQTVNQLKSLKGIWRKKP